MMAGERKEAVQELSNADFAMFCAYIAKSASAWAGDSLSLDGGNIRPSDAARFTDEMRRRLDHIDGRAGRPLSGEGKQEAGK